MHKSEYISSKLSDEFNGTNYLTESLKIGFDRLILQKEMMFCWSPKIYVDLSKPGI